MGQERKAQGSGPRYQEVSWVSPSALSSNPLVPRAPDWATQLLPILTPDSRGSRGCATSAGGQGVCASGRMECISPDSPRQTECNMWTPFRERKH